MRTQPKDDEEVTTVSHEEATVSQVKSRLACLLMVILALGIGSLGMGSLASVSGLPRIIKPLVAVAYRRTADVHPLEGPLSSLGQSYDLWNQSDGKMPLAVMEKYSLRSYKSPEAG